MSVDILRMMCYNTDIPKLYRGLNLCIMVITEQAQQNSTWIEV